LKKDMSKKKSKPADPREAQLETAMTACRRLNRAVRFSFLREIFKSCKCQQAEAEDIFNSWIREGRILEVDHANGVKIYCIK